MGRLPAGALQPLQTVGGQRLPLAGLDEALGVFGELGAGGEQTTAQPQQLPALLQAEPGSTHGGRGGHLTTDEPDLLVPDP